MVGFKSLSFELFFLFWVVVHHLVIEAALRSYGARGFEGREFVFPLNLPFCLLTGQIYGFENIEQLQSF